jgi:type IV pilus assembly protein PilZ
MLYQDPDHLCHSLSVVEKRQHPRKALQVPIAFDFNGARVEAVCTDLSIGGAFIETNHVAPFGTAVRVYLRLPALETEVTVDCTVRWTKPEGMGVQFGLMGARETHALVQTIK